MTFLRHSLRKHVTVWLRKCWAGRGLGNNPLTKIDWRSQAQCTMLLAGIMALIVVALFLIFVFVALFQVQHIEVDYEVSPIGVRNIYDLLN
jgi:hypothetical protein